MARGPASITHSNISAECAKIFLLDANYTVDPNLASVCARHPFVGPCNFSRRKVTTSSFDVSNRVNVHSKYPGQIQRPFAVDCLSTLCLVIFAFVCVSIKIVDFSTTESAKTTWFRQELGGRRLNLQARDDPLSWPNFASVQIFHCGKWLSLWQKVTIVQAATGVYGFLRLSFSESGIGLRHKHSLSCLFTVSRLLASESKLMRSLTGYAS